MKMGTKKINVETLKKRLKEVQTTYKELVDSGVSRELLIIYLGHKCGISMKKAKQVLEHTDEFYDKLMTDVVIENL
jgi:hypothetical protein